MNYEPDNGPEIDIPDSDTWTPADGEWPKCPGTVECKFVGLFASGNVSHLFVGLFAIGTV